MSVTQIDPQQEVPESSRRSKPARARILYAHRDQVVASVQQLLAELEAEPVHALVPRLGGAKRHLLRSKGKLVRPMMVWLLGRALDVPGARLASYATVVEMIHAASLLHDDVIDRADRRRHLPSANASYDNRIPVLAGDALLADVMDRVAELGDVATIRGVARAVQDLVAGEVLQYELQGEVHGSVETCIEVAELKTAALLSLCTWLPAHLAGLGEDARRSYASMGRTVGVAFQLTDDVLDFEAADSGKPAFGDWQEARTNAVTAALVRRVPQAAPRLQDYFASPAPRSAERSRQLCGALFSAAELAAAVADVRALAGDYVALAERHAEQLPDNDLGRLFVDLQRRLLGRSR